MRRQGRRRHCARTGPLILLTTLVLPSGAFGALTGEENDSEQIDDGRRTMSHLPANIGRGFIGVFQRESVKPFLIGAAATGLSTLLDDEVRDAIADEDDATAEFAGRAEIDDDGNLRRYVAGTPFPQDSIDPAAADAGIRWAWNLQTRYRGAGPIGAFRILDMPASVGSMISSRMRCRNGSSRIESSQ